MSKTEKQQERKSKRDGLEKELAAVKVQLAASERAVAQLQEQLTKLKNSSIDTVADYKRRFVEMQRQTEVTTTVAAEAEAARRADGLKNENRIIELNARFGEKIRLLQEDLAQEKQSGAQVLTFAAPSNGWVDIEPVSVAAKMVKDLQLQLVGQAEELRELREFHAQVMAEEERTDENGDVQQSDDRVDGEDETQRAGDVNHEAD